MKKKIIIFLALGIFSFVNIQYSYVYALTYSEMQNKLSEIFTRFTDDNEGTTAFRSLLLPFGGRAESLGNAYTGLADDLSFFIYNPAASSLQKETQFGVYHNSWIADSNFETIAYTTRKNNLGLGVQASCFYVPFTEYNIFGDRTSGNYYTETTVVLNASYNFLNGYDFKGLALGANVKASWRGMPNYTDNDTNEIIPSSGLSQSALGIMADIGLLLRFNFLKFYNSREPNVKIGLSARNLGVAITGFKSPTGIKLDDSLPTIFAVGFSVTFIEPITVSVDFKQPIDFSAITTYLLPSLSAGVSVNFTNFISVLAGFELKGGNPRISAGAEFQFSKVRLNLNYTLDLSTSFAPANRFSISSKILLGDKGRSKIDDKVDYYYMKGLEYYSENNWEEAIAQWNEALLLNKRFDPAILGIKSAQSQIEMFKHIKESLLLEP